MTRNILFVCKHNAFRSKFAESIFKRLNRNSRYNVKSAGIIKSNKLDSIERKVGNSLGFTIKGPPQSLKLTDLFWADIIIVVADDVPPMIFNSMKKRGKKIIVWKIKDVHNHNEEKITKAIISIRENIKNLVKNLK